MFDTTIWQALDFDALLAFLFSSHYYFLYSPKVVDAFGSGMQVCLCFVICDPAVISREAGQECETECLSVVGHVEPEIGQ